MKFIYIALFVAVFIAYAAVEVSPLPNPNPARAVTYQPGCGAECLCSQYGYEPICAEDIIIGGILGLSSRCFVVCENCLSPPGRYKVLPGVTDC